MKSGRKTGWSKTADQVGDDADPEFTSEDPSLGPEQERARSKNAPSSATLRSQAGTPHVKGQARKPPKRGYLDGQMLIAMPTMGDERFARSVIYICAHSTEGAMGIVVNQLASNITFPDLL